MAEGGLWEVVGGADKGGILVREAQSVTSAQLPQRLGTGSVVRQRELVDDRLHYELVAGSGPPEGWVSITLKTTKSLLLRLDAGFNFQAAKPLVSLETPKPAHVPEELLKTLEPFDKKRWNDAEFITEHVYENLPGDFYQMWFPHTFAQLEDAGPEWLTKAFHAAGTLPADNRVVRIVNGKSFPGGGAGLKATLEVEYATPSEELHNELFIKLPLPMREKNRHLCIGLAQEGPEIMFSRFFSHCLPLRTPKYYFGDFNIKSTNWILIFEKLKLADRSLRGQRMPPFEFEAAPLKGMDCLLSDKVEKYYALWRANALMAAWAHTGKLGEQFRTLCKSPPYPAMLFPRTEKQFRPFLEETREFVLDIAPGFFPKDIACEAYMKQLGEEALEVATGIHCFNEFLKSSGQDMGFIHCNCQVDNGFYWVDEEGRTDVGLLDWGGILVMSYITPLLSGNLMSADADVRAFHLYGLCKCFADTLLAHGGPEMNAMNMYHYAGIWDMATVINGMTVVVKAELFGGIYEWKPKSWFKTVSDLNDPVFLVEDVNTLMLRQPIIALVEGLKAWKHGEYFKRFMAWRELFGTEVRKAKR